MKHHKIKGLIFISNVTKAMEHEWFVEYTDRSQFDLEFVLFNSKNSELHNFIRRIQVPVKNYSLPNKYLIPFYVLYFTAKMLFNRPDLVHGHLFQASIIGMLSAKLAGIKKRIYTRHHADVHHTYHPNAVKYDLMVNKLATHIIAVSINIQSILMEMEGVPEQKITVITHGIPLQLIDPKIDPPAIEEMRKKYGLESYSPLIGVISRFVPEKGIQYIIPAFKQLLADYPHAKLILANARGKYEKEVTILLRDIPESSYLLIRFETNVNPLFKTFDVFVHAPIDPTCEAFGQVYIEALSLGVPMVCCISGIAHDMIIHERNALVAEYKSADSLYQKIKAMLVNESLRKHIIGNGKIDVKEYTFEKKFEKIKALYLS